MNDDTGSVLPFSDAAYNRGTVIGPRSEAAPSVASVTPVSSGRVEGTDLAPHRAGIFATLTDKTGEVVTNRDPVDTDRVTVELDSGNVTTMTLRQAKFAGYANQDEHGRWFEIDRTNIRAIESELARVKHAQRDAQSVKYSGAVETGAAALDAAMSEDGLSFTDTLATLMGGGEVPEPVARWGNARGVDVRQQAQNYMNQMRAHVIANVLTPMGVEPEPFYNWLRNSGVTRAQHIKAAMGLHVLRDDSAYRYLAQQYRAVGRGFGRGSAK